MNTCLPLPDTETLRELFDYDPETGVLSWKSGRYAGKPCGYLAGDTRKGYLRVKVKGTHYRVHRLIWKHHHDEDIPEGYFIDHIDHNTQNNRIENLRLLTNADNLRHRRKKQ
jgi:hypothetical protein